MNRDVLGPSSSLYTGRCSSPPRFLAEREALKATLADILSRRHEISVERTAEQMEQMVILAGNDLSAAQIERKTRLVRELRAALERMDDGSYGECLACEEPIAPKRLAAIPWAKHCIRCAEQAERCPSGSTEDLEARLETEAMAWRDVA